MEISRDEVLTVANGVSAAGAVIALHGATELDSWQGIVEVAAGEALDLVDGPIARSRGETSQFSAGVDAGLDKLKALAIMIAEWKKGLAPRASLALIAGHNAVNTAVTLVGMYNHPDEDFAPSKDGKRSMFIENIALSAYPVSARLEKDGKRGASVAKWIGHTATAFGVGYYGVPATIGYFKKARKNR
jgi:phosphatidylglycerophosphate synthase